MGLIASAVSADAFSVAESSRDVSDPSSRTRTLTPGSVRGSLTSRLRDSESLSKTRRRPQGIQGPPGPVTFTGTFNAAGSSGFLSEFSGSSNIANSAIYDSGGAIGIGTTTPLDRLHVRFTNTAGNFTGYAVQNLGNTSTSYSGMLF